MTITIGTATLVGLLTDALQTAETDLDEVSVGVHVATHRSGFGDEPGNVDLIAVTSTDRFVVGHTFDIVSGQIISSVWPVDATKTVLLICKGLLQTRGKEHTVDIEVVERVPDGEPSGDEKPHHPGYTVTLSETPALFDTDTEFQFHAEHEASFPIATIRKALSGVVDAVTDEGDAAGVPTEGPETIWNAHVLVPLSAISKRRKDSMRFYRTPGKWAQVVQIGAAWIGAAMPVRPVPGEDASGPSIDPLLPAPSPAGEELGAE